VVQDPGDGDGRVGVEALQLVRLGDREVPVLGTRDDLDGRTHPSIRVDGRETLQIVPYPHGQFGVELLEAFGVRVRQKVDHTPRLRPQVSRLALAQVVQGIGGVAGDRAHLVEEPLAVLAGRERRDQGPRHHV
jgi:hypothetical protein